MRKREVGGESGRETGRETGRKLENKSPSLERPLTPKATWIKVSQC